LTEYSIKWQLSARKKMNLRGFQKQRINVLTGWVTRKIPSWRYRNRFSAMRCWGQWR